MRIRSGALWAALSFELWWRALGAPRADDANDTESAWASRSAARDPDRGA